MGSYPTYKNRVQYALFNESAGYQIIQDPENWATDAKEYARNEDYHGIISKFSNALVFLGNGADYVTFVKETFGIEARIRLTRDVANPYTDIFERDYEGDLDLSTYEKQDNKVSVKFNTAGIESQIKARESEPIEIERLTTMDGAPMDPIRIDNVALMGRKILLKTFFNVKPDNNMAAVSIFANNNNVRHQTVGVPLNLYSESHEEAQSVTAQVHGNDLHGETGMMFFADSEVARSLKIKFDMSFWTNITIKDENSSSLYYLCLTKYTDGINYQRTPPIVLFDAENLPGGFDAMGGDVFANPFTGVNNNPRTFHTVSYDGTINLQEGESLALEFYIKSTLGGVVSRGHLAVEAQDIVINNMTVIEDSFYEKSESKFILAYEMANRLLETMTGKKSALRSDFFGRTDIGYPVDGKGSLNGFTHGFWVRKFDRLPEGTEEAPNLFKQITTSWRDFIQANQCVWNIGLGIERIGNMEQVVIEELGYFYRNNVTIVLPNKINKAKRSVAAKYYYSGIEIGYSKGGEYDEAMGLDEYNAISTYTTIISRIKSTFSKISPYRADSYGKEFARRKPITRYPTQDTRYDSDIFQMDLKRGATDDGRPFNGPRPYFEERLWQDDFDESPTGTYSPETATNLRFSPFNMLLRHGWVLAAGLTKYLTDYIRYSSSTANSGLTTKLKGGQRYSENGTIINSELERPKYIPDFIEFEHEVDSDILKKIEGYTTIEGRNIPNLYGQIQFIDENNNISRGYLINLKPNEGKFKLLIANR